MFTIIYRRLQRYSLVLKLLGLVFSVSGIAALAYFSSPELLNILLAAFLLWLGSFCLLSFFVNSRVSLLASVALAFLVFLKAVDLLTTLNLILLFTFLVLLMLYFRNPKEVKQQTEKPQEHRKD